MDCIKAAMDRAYGFEQECVRVTNYIESVDLVSELKGVKHYMLADSVYIDRQTFT